MASNPPPAHRLPADDPFFNTTLSNLPVKSGASSLYDPPKTFNQIHGSDIVYDFSLSTAADGHGSQKQSIGRPGHVINSDYNPAAIGLGPEPRSVLYPGWISQRPGCLYHSQEETPGFSVDRFPSVHGNPQHQLGRVLVSPPITSPSCLQTSTNQQHSNMIESPASREQISAAQPKSVKHLTCWYWANKGCKLPDHLCLYSHFDTGRLAEAPIQVQRGRESSSYYPSLHLGPLYEPRFVKLYIKFTLTPS